METYSSKPMLFVTGASRSGTTVLTGMLRKHADVAGLNELHYFGDVWDPRSGPRTFGREQQRTRVALLLERQRLGILQAGHGQPHSAEVDEVLRRFPDECDAPELFAGTVDYLAKDSGKVVPCEQTPRNIYYARDLLECYPQARFVHLVRDPRAVVASQKHRWRRRSLMDDPSRMSRRQQLRTWVNYHPYTATQLWSVATVLALELLDHPRFVTLKFEDLVREPEARMRELCDFIGIEFRESMLEIEHLNSSYVSTRSGGRGLSPAAVDAWRTRLDPDECALVEKRCDALMRRLDYRPEFEDVSGPQRARFAVSYVGHLAGAAVVNPRRLWIQGRAVLGRNGQRSRAPGESRSGDGSSGGEEADNPEAELARVFGLPFVDTELETAAQDLVDCARMGIRRRVAFVNAHTLNVSVRDEALRRALRSFEIIYADGVGMAMAARLQGARLHHNVNGTDLCPHLCRAAAGAAVPIALLGATPEVVEACARAMQARHPGLFIVWRHHGFLDAAASTRVVEEINRSGARILLVAMGVPRQELWIAAHSRALAPAVVIGVGGLFDFVSGRMPRAPAALRRFRLEWLFRLLVEPRRLWGRYVLGNPMFLARAVKYAFTGNARPIGKRRART